jgi:steroid delta-isomerase-like uncharacterized protein
MTAIGSPETVELARKAVDAFSTGDWERLRTALAPDAVWEQVPTEDRFEGPDAVVDVNRGWKQAFPDARGTVTNALCADDTAVLEATYEGTHDGDLQTPQGAIPPSGRKATVRAVLVVRVADGRITEVRQYFDMLTILGQIGAAPQAQR